MYLDDMGLRLLKDDGLLCNDEIEYLIKQGFTIADIERTYYDYLVELIKPNG